jgi:hypothetical protein
MMETKNAIIKSVTLSNADHGCLSSFIQLDFGDSSQGFGGYNLYSKGIRNGNYAGLFINSVLEVVGVNEWSKLVGKPVRVKADYGKVYAIGHIIEDKWFDPEQEVKKLNVEIKNSD